MIQTSDLYARLGLPVFAKMARWDEECLAKHPPTPRAMPAKPPAPPVQPRWKFAVVPDEAITRCTKASARLALHGVLEGYAVWVKLWRFRRHAELGRILTLREDMVLIAEKREKRSRGWKTVDSKELDRKAMLDQFAEVKVSWDDLEREYIENDDPDWKTDGRAYVVEHKPAPLEREERGIANELLMENEEDASWKELDSES